MLAPSDSFHTGRGTRLAADGDGAGTRAGEPDGDHAEGAVRSPRHAPGRDGGGDDDDGEPGDHAQL